MRKSARGTPDAEIARQAAEASGALSLDELKACGLSGRAAAGRADGGGRLHRVHHAVYAVGHDNLPLEGRFVAAVKACGPNAALSHLAAAARDGQLEWDEDWPIDVTVKGVGTRRHHGLRVHRTKWLDRRDLVFRGGIWVTAPWRVVLDLAAIFPEKRLRRFVRQALSEGYVSLRQLVDVLDRGGPRRGSGRLARVLADAEPTRSDLEDLVHDLIISAGFERPDVNKPLVIGGRTIIPDFRWPEQRLVVEADSRKWHDNPLARADDAERQALLEASGERVERVTWTDATVRRNATRSRLAEAGAPHFQHRGTRK